MTSSGMSHSERITPPVIAPIFLAGTSFLFSCSSTYLTILLVNGVSSVIYFKDAEDFPRFLSWQQKNNLTVISILATKNNPGSISSPSTHRWFIYQFLQEPIA